MPLTFFIVIASVCQTNAQSTKSRFKINDFKCCWQLEKIVYESGGMYGSADEARLKGTVICFNKDTINILGDTITEARYTIKKESTEAFTVRNFQVFQDIPKWFGITVDSVYNIKLSGKYNTKDALGNPSQSKTDYELAFDGAYLYLNDGNGSLFKLTKYHKNATKRYVGSGSTIKQFTLSGKEKSLNLFYEFYTDPDEIIVYDQNDKELYHSEMVSTNQEKKINIKLYNTNKLTIKIISKAANSRWAFWFDAK